MNPRREDLWRDLVELTRLPHRGSGTREEAHAARWLAARLQELGYRVEIQEFRTPRHTLYLGPAWTGMALAALALASQGLAGAGAALAAAGALVVLLPLVGEVLLWPYGWPINLTPLLPRGRSQNVLARPGPVRNATAGGTGSPGEGDPQEAPRAGDGAVRPFHLFLVAHYDTQWGSWLFAPRFLPFTRSFFTLGYAGFVAVPLLLFLRAAGVAGASAALLAAGILDAAVAGFLLLCWLTGRPVNGANDNGSGVAVALELARRLQAQPLPGAEVTVALTGAEEVGMRGMAALVGHPLFRRALARGRDRVVVINLDNLGRGRLHYLTGEGLVLPVAYDRRLVRLAARVAAALPTGRLTPGPRPLLPTDALLPAARKIPAITFLATGPDGRIPHYHWHSDRLEHVDRRHLEEVADAVWAFLQALATEWAAPQIGSRTD
ncbi:MAG: peptidase M28 [Bacillota bacterium]|nr:MAG: peptidase M28 [Bacillota bacterium]